MIQSEVVILKMAKKSPKEIAWETVKTIIYAFIVATIIRLYVFETMLVPTPSMVPTIMVGDRLFVEKITYTVREPQIGDIVVFWSPTPDERAQQMLRAFDKFMDLFSPREYKGHVKYVKRLVGKEGDTLEIKKGPDGKYHLFVNGKVPEALKDVEYEPDGVFKYPEFYNWLFQASLIRNDPNKYRNFLMELLRKTGEVGQYIKNQQLLSIGKREGLKPTVADLIFSIVGGRSPNGMKYPGEPYDGYAKNFLKDYIKKTSGLPKLDLSKFIKKAPDGHVILKIPKGFYFFMGDNSKESLDSRFFGFVPKKNVIGMPILRIWPFNRFGPVQPETQHHTH